MEKWLTFYESAFDSLDEAKEFVSNLENVNDRNSPKHRAKIMMHQAQRLISLADKIVGIRPGKESLQLLFLLICAENIAKLHYNFNGEGQSKSHVHKFFNEFVIEPDRGVLENGLLAHDQSSLDLKEVINALYSVRCDVVHEGRYWDFAFSDGSTDMYNFNPHVVVRITLSQFRSIVVRACVHAIQRSAAA